MAQSIRERIPELAILKTLGFSDGKVTALVLAEAVLMLLLGGAHRHGRRRQPDARAERCHRRPLPAAVRRCGDLAAGRSASPWALALAIGLPPALRVPGDCGSSTRWRDTADALAQSGRADHADQPAQRAAAAGHLAGRRHRHRRRGRRARLGVGHGRGLPSHAGQHRPPQPRDHAARRLRRRAVERRGARPGDRCSPACRRSPATPRAVRSPRPSWW